jgi:hypothetical protein
MLIEAGHECWATSQAGRSAAADDDQTVYADEHGAVLMTHDQEFTERRKRNTIGRHIRLMCEQPDGPDLLRRCLVEIVPVLEHRLDVVMEIRVTGVSTYFSRWD